MSLIVQPDFLCTLEKMRQLLGESSIKIVPICLAIAFNSLHFKKLSNMANKLAKNDEKPFKLVFKPLLSLFWTSYS